jgi:uncharacterized protein
VIAQSPDLVPGCLGSSLAGSRGDEIAGKFELFKDAHGEFRFHLKAANGEIVATSEGYSSKASAENGIKSVQISAHGATVVDKTG